MISAASAAQIAPFAAGLALVIFLITHSLMPYFATQPNAGAPEPAFEQALNANAPKILAHFNIPGMVISTVVDGVPARSYAYGWADVEHHRPVTADTVFRVASLSKSVTAWGVMRLVQSGRVDLDKPAETYLSEWPWARSTFPSHAVSVRSLLNHTSGLSAGDDLFRLPSERALTTAGLVKTLAAQHVKLEAPAGVGYAYSVPGYTTLQLMIEHQTGESFDTYMRRSVLAPLGMKSSSYDWNPAFQARMATPYAAGKPLALMVPQDQAADSLFSTASDIARFVAAALPDRSDPGGEGVLAPQSVNHMYAAPSAVPRFGLAGLEPDEPALGYFVERAPGGRLVLINGGYDAGWSSSFFMVPDTGDGLVVLTNSDEAEPAIAQVAAIWSSWRGLPPMKMTRAYRIIGFDASVVLGLLAMLTSSYALDLGADLRAGRRRMGEFNIRATSVSLLECGLALASTWMWVLTRPSIENLPTFSLVANSVIWSFILTVLVRLVIPTRKREPKPRTADGGLPSWLPLLGRKRAAA